MIQFDKKRGSVYIDYLTKLLNGKKINDQHLLLENEDANGNIFLIEDSNFRIISIDYIPKKDLSIDFNPDEKFKFTFKCFANKVIYKNDIEELKLNVSNGLIFLKNKEKIITYNPKGKRVQQITIYFNQEKVSSYLSDILSHSKDFIYHTGDDHLMEWKNVFFHQNKKSLHEDYYFSWKVKKLEEFFILVQNLLTTFNKTDLKKTFSDYEFQLITDLKEKIESDLSEKPVLKEVAEQYGINKNKINYLFKLLYGTTFYKYYNKLRTQAAKNEIVNTDKSMIEIAYEFNFTDTNHLSKSISKMYGLNPSQLRLID